MPLSKALKVARVTRLVSLFLLVCLYSFSDAVAAVDEPSPVERTRATPRYLFYPPPASGAPTKVQLIFGLGIPMEVEVSTIVGYVMKCNYNLPYNATSLSAPYLRHGRSTSDDAKLAGRYEIYKILESLVDSSFQSGKACLLRAICEAAATPLTSADGLFSQLLHIFLTPSSTEEPLNEANDQEYLAAEHLGHSLKSNCERVFTECDRNFLDYISKRH